MQVRHALAVSLLSLALAVPSMFGQSAPVSGRAEVSVPNVIRYSGTVKEASGQQIGVTFALYSDEQGGSPLWKALSMETAAPEERLWFLSPASWIKAEWMFELA